MSKVALVPVGTGERIANALNSLLTLAQDQILAEHGDVAKGGEQLEAEVVHRMLRLSEEERLLQRSAQGVIVSYVARKELWRLHPESHSSLRQFLYSAGLSKSTVSDLNALGTVIVPFCDSHKIAVDPLLAADKWPKLREAIPAVRRAINDSDPEQVQDILADVGKATNRDAVRKKYRDKRTRYGHGTTVRLGDGRVLLVALLDDDNATEIVIHRLNGALEWDLVLGTQIIGKSLKLVMSND